MFYSYLPTFLFLLKFSSSSRVSRSCLLAPKFSSPATTTLPAISTLPSIHLPEFFFFILPFIRAPLPFFSRSPRPAPLRARSLSHPPFSLSISPADGWATAPLLLFLRAVLPFLLPFPRRVLSLCLGGRPDYRAAAAASLRQVPSLHRGAMSSSCSSLATSSTSCACVQPCPLLGPPPPLSTPIGLVCC